MTDDGFSTMPYLTVRGTEEPTQTTLTVDGKRLEDGYPVVAFTHHRGELTFEFHLSLDESQKFREAIRKAETEVVEEENGFDLAGEQ